jgi:phytoene desaturase
MLMKTEAARPRAATIDPNAPLALVIGSGFGGLAAAVRLGARGWHCSRVTTWPPPSARGAWAGLCGSTRVV